MRIQCNVCLLLSRFVGSVHLLASELRTYSLEFEPEKVVMLASLFRFMKYVWFAIDLEEFINQLVQLKSPTKTFVFHIPSKLLIFQ